MCAWRRFGSKPQSLGARYEPKAHGPSLDARVLHDTHVGSPGLEAHCELPRGAWKPDPMKRYPCPASERASTSESFSSLTTTTSTSESGLRKSRRCRRSSASTPDHVPRWFETTIVQYGPGCT